MTDQTAQQPKPETTDDLLRILIEELRSLNETMKAVNGSVKHGNRHKR